MIYLFSRTTLFTGTEKVFGVSWYFARKQCSKVVELGRVSSFTKDYKGGTNIYLELDTISLRATWRSSVRFIESECKMKR